MSSELRVLAIDTSTEACSAALLLQDTTIALRFKLTERGHADLILPMIDELLREAGLRVMDLDGLAFGRGPGSFTGLRVAAGVIQGLAFGANLRVAPVSSLAAVAFQVLSSGSGGVLVCNDARMNEVYWGCYAAGADAGDTLIPIMPEQVGAASAVTVPAGVQHFAGNAFTREPQLLARLQAAGLQHHAGLYPSADAIARMGAAMLRRGESVAAADALPVYVRDNVAQVAKPPVMGMS